ncbi:MAG: flagellar motor switch protein FliN [Nitrospirota bacterium]
MESEDKELQGGGEEKSGGIQGAPAVSFGEMRAAPKTGKPQGMDFIMDIPVRLSVELGRAKVLVGELLHLSHGSVIELDKIAGEPMEVLVNDRLIAKGEVVQINDKLGIRLTDIISEMERIKRVE